MWRDLHKRGIAAYFSILGVKIAVVIGVFLLLATFLNLYIHGGMESAYQNVLLPSFWVIQGVIFIAVMAVMSKLVILPLKRFEVHLRELEQHRTEEPFVLKRRDEIGYLTERFNSLHRNITEKIQKKDRQLYVLHSFLNTASGVFDIHSLMIHFFNILRTVCNFDIGIYVVNHKGLSEGRIFSYADLDLIKREELSKNLLKRARLYVPDFPAERFGILEVTRLIDKRGGERFESLEWNSLRSKELPIICFGRPVGIVALITLGKDGEGDFHEPVVESRVVNSMIRHTSIMVERILTHIFAEEKKLSRILSSMIEGVYLIDRDGHITSINPKGQELLSDFCRFGMDCLKRGVRFGPIECPHPVEASCEFAKFIAKIRTHNYTINGRVYTEEIKGYDGRILQLSVCNLTTEDNRPDGYVITARDVTEERLIQERLFQSSKLAALGEMAAGIAHEVNNPLQVVMGNIELLECLSGGDTRLTKRLGQMKDGILRIKSIIRNLLIFAREQTTDIEEVNINDIILNSVDMMKNQLKFANIAVELDLDRRSLMVMCNKNLFQQVIINLLQNAKDAIEESGKGSSIYLRTVLLPGGIVVVEVSDDGPGIPKKIIDKIFLPFFTTKGVGKGTGLGLSISRKIIEEIGGNISVSSPSSGGTTFRITLLHHRKSRRKERRMVEEEPGQDLSVLSSKSVFMIDDEEEVVRVTKEILESKVETFEYVNTGKSALERLMDRDYDFILLDLKMPGVDGFELYRRITEAKPYLGERIIFLTGDTESEASKAFLKLTGCRYLAKPFVVDDLLKVMCDQVTCVSG